MNRRVGAFTDTGQHFQNEEVQSLGLYWENIEVLCKLLRFMGYLPYQINKAHDKIETSLKSKLWAVIACTVLVISVCLEDQIRFKTAEYWNSYEKVLESLTRLMFTNTTIFYVSTWWDLPKLVTYINGWSKFTSNLTKMSKACKQSNSSLILKVFLLIIAVLIISAIIVDQIIFTGSVEPLRLFSYFATVYFSIVFTTFWIVNCNFVIRMARILRNSLIKTINEKPNTGLLKSYCLLWLQLRQKTQELTEALKLSLILHIILNLISFIFMSFVMMSTLIYRPEIKHFIAYLSPLLITTTTLISICESSNSVTNELGYEYTIELLSLKISQPHVAEEVDLLIEIIEGSPTEIIIVECVTLNKRFIMTLISTTITYIIVLVQFDVSSRHD